MDNQQYCLKWNNFSQHLKYAFNTIWSSDDSFTDVTLAVQGRLQNAGPQDGPVCLLILFQKAAGGKLVHLLFLSHLV